MGCTPVLAPFLRWLLPGMSALLLSLPSHGQPGPRAPDVQSPESWSYQASEVRVDRFGKPSFARDFRAEFPHAHVTSGLAEFPQWPGGPDPLLEVIRLSGDVLVALDAGLVLSFDAGELHASGERIRIDGALTVLVEAGLLQDDPDLMSSGATYTCRLGRLIRDGVNTGYTSVCLPGGTRLLCRGDLLEVQTRSPHCSER
jgi:hypothetical protein